jgi:hypothetical protein
LLGRIRYLITQTAPSPNARPFGAANTPTAGIRFVQTTEFVSGSMRESAPSGPRRPGPLNVQTAPSPNAIAFTESARIRRTSALALVLTLETISPQEVAEHMGRDKRVHDPDRARSRGNLGWRRKSSASNPETRSAHVDSVRDLVE